MMFLAMWTMKILPCSLIILRHLKEKQYEGIEGKTIDEVISLKHQKMEELEAEIEELEEKKTQDDSDENLIPTKSEVSQEDYSSDYFDKFLEYENNSNIQEHDDEEATITIVEESVNSDDTEIKNDELEEDDTGCDGPEFDDFYGEFCPKEYRAKRDATGDFLGGILQTGEKLLEGNIGGSITTFLKTVARPVYHYLIQSDNDPVMEKFTNRLVPETSFQGSSNAIMMQGAAEVGDGARVWDTMHHNSEAWNPRSSWTHLKDRSEAEQLAFKKYIPTILAIDKTISRRLKDVSLVITTLSTSLHDTMVEGMNEGFKTASEILKDMEGENRSIIRVLKSLIDVIESDIPTDMKIAAITVIAILIILQSGLGFWQNRTTQLQIGSVETVVRDMAQKMEEMQQLMKETEAKEAKMKKQVEDMIQEKRQVESNFAVAIAQAVEQTMNRAIEDARFQPLQKLQSSHTDRRDQTTDQMQTGSRYKGNSVSSYSGPNTVALLGSR